MLVWFGLFMVIAGAAFQMWQTAAGGASFNGAFQYFAASAFVLITLNVLKD
jgi:predicted small integral membrane protein